MPMHYEHEFIPPAAIPRARLPLLQHVVDTYASETSKTAGVWSELADDQLEFRPHARSSPVRQILVHQLLSERRFFGEFVGLDEPPPDTLLPEGERPAVAAYVERLVALARPRLVPLAEGDAAFWLAEVPSSMCGASGSGSSGAGCSTPPTTGPRWACASECSRIACRRRTAPPPT